MSKSAYNSTNADAVAIPQLHTETIDWRHRDKRIKNCHLYHTKATKFGTTM